MENAFLCTDYWVTKCDFPKKETMSVTKLNGKEKKEQIKLTS